MADTKISELPVATAIASPDVAPVVRSGVTMQADVSLFGVSPQAAATFHSTGDSTNISTFTASNSGIKQLDVNDIEMGRVWFGGSADAGGSLFVGDFLPSGFVGSQDNVALGFGSMLSVTVDAARNLAIGTGSLLDLTTGASNICIGYHAGQSIDEGGDNVAIGDTADVLEPGGIGMTLIGSQVDSGVGVTDNATAIGYLTTVTADNTVVIGNKDVTDVHFGFNDMTSSANAILHGKGDAIVFPDSDPHVAGAAYWVLGVLTRSAG